MTQCFLFITPLLFYNKEKQNHWTTEQTHNVMNESANMSFLIYLLKKRFLISATQSSFPYVYPVLLNLLVFLSLQQALGLGSIFSCLFGLHILDGCRCSLDQLSVWEKGSHTDPSNTLEISLLLSFPYIRLPHYFNWSSMCVLHCHVDEWRQKKAYLDTECICSRSLIALIVSTCYEILFDSKS